MSFALVTGVQTCALPISVAAGHPIGLRYETHMSLPPLLRALRLPVIGAPLFIISVPDLVIAPCKAGVVGSFPALNARPHSLLHEWLHRIPEELAARSEERSVGQEGVGACRSQGQP